MININNILTAELNLKLWQVENSIELKLDGATLPFIARYRKERTGEMDENQLRDLFERFEYLTELEERKAVILKSIDEQGKLTDELRKKIEATLQKNELEDLYLPYKPKRRTRAVIAKEKGLEPLANMIKSHNRADSPEFDFDGVAGKFISESLGVESAVDALKGASDILAEEIAETAELRAWVRDYFLRKGVFTSKIKDDFPDGSTKYENYHEFEMPVRNIKSHAMLALRRGESEKIIVLDLKYEEEEILSYIDMKTLFSANERMSEFYFKLTKDAFSRLMKHSLIGEVRLEKKKEADEESIRVFEENLRQLLLSSPAGRKMTLGIDPGFRTGCKVVVVDNTGKFLENTTIYLLSDGQKAQAEGIILALLKKYDIELIAIGNGTAGRETDDFITITVDKIEKNPIKVLVNEAGASVYSAGKAANEEFPELDLTVRGAISIARRLQDPLAELVKIDPKSIGVGQYQHDVDQKLLKKKLEDTVESCVNFVGVDLNTASKELLTYVSGLSSTVAKNIVAYRNQNGAFANRKDVKKVTMFGAKAFEQAAGFLRIPAGKNVLDNTAVHPESYGIVKQMAADLKIPIAEIGKQGEKLKDIDLKKYVTDSVGIPTLRDIIAELMKPGRDPRAEFKYAEFDSTIKEIRDLKEGMILEGVITNITNFGAFTDIGVHQDGLVHISQLANRFVKHPTDVVKVGQIVKVKVTEVNEKLKRIGLSMKDCVE